MIGKSGTGAVVFVSIGKPSSWRHEFGCSPRNSTLCERVLSAWSQVTFSPAPISTTLSVGSPPTSWKKLSSTFIVASAAVANLTVDGAAGALVTVGAVRSPRTAAPDANAGIAISAAMTHASHGRTDFLTTFSPPQDPTNRTATL